MMTPDMAAITASLERSMQKFSLRNPGGGGGGGGGRVCSRSSETRESSGESDSLELNSEISLPYYWEQCLDLKTGEVYYVNWRNGMKTKEDPRLTPRLIEEDYSDDEEDSSIESDSSWSASPPSSSTDDFCKQKDHVLVVAGCKQCLMYFMLPKTVDECPKCNGIIVHFNRLENGRL